MHLFFLLAGLGLLYIGAEILVRGSSNIAIKLGIRPIIVGLTVVAFGTSSPELVVSLKSASEGASALALGNVIGSNICNIALIAGVAALIRPVAVSRETINKDIAVMITASLLIVFFISNSDARIISRPEGIILFGLFVSYLVYTIVTANKTRKLDKATMQSVTPTDYKTNMFVNILFVVAGLAGLVYGSDLFVEGAVGIARTLGVSEAVIGLTLVAFGTSLPELATTVVAAIKKENDIAFGNAVGSNIFNILLVIGAAGSLFPLSGVDIEPADLAIMLAVAIIVVPMVRGNYRLSRPAGAFLIIYYLAYIVYKAFEMQ